MSQLLEVNRIVCHIQHEPNSPAVVNQLDFVVKDGEIGCLLGSSGCGKTTALRAIAGFQPISSGSITLNGKLLSSNKVHLAPEKRRVGMVFQDYALFPHINVRDNITFGLHKMKASAKDKICQELLQLVKLENFAQRFPHELSGGQQQRVALARALAPAPDLLLLDEPLSSLDTELRRSLAIEVRNILKERGISAIMVTHDQEEAFAFADKIGVVNNGCLEQWDIPYNLYHEPQTRFVANFVGQGVFLPGFIRDPNAIETELGILQSHKHYSWLSNTEVEVLLRPDDIVLDSDSPYQAKIVDKVFTGTATLYTLQLSSGAKIEAAFHSHHNFDLGYEVGIKVQADHLIAFSGSSLYQPKIFTNPKSSPATVTKL